MQKSGFKDEPFGGKHVESNDSIMNQIQGNREETKQVELQKDTNNIQILEQFTINEPPKTESQMSSSRPGVTISL